MTSGERLEDAADRLAAALGRPVERDVPFASLTTYGLGGPAAVLARLRDEEDLAAVAGALPSGVPFLCVGRGSNLLVADEGFAGVAVLLDGPLTELRIVPDPADGGRAAVIAGGGVRLPVLARQAAAAGWGGVEFFAGIPGSVGGAVRMNAGGHGKETLEVLRRAWVVDLAEGVPAVQERPVDSLQLTYRHSNLGPAHVVVRAEFAAAARPPEECKAEIDEVVRWRRANQPGGNNAGSVFTNPPGDSAGRLIDACGLKGFRVGTAWVSERHANFFQAEPDGRGRAADVVALVLEVQRRVEAETGFRLVPELRRVAFAGMAGAHPAAPEAWPGDDHAAIAGRPDPLSSSATAVVADGRGGGGAGPIGPGPRCSATPVTAEERRTVTSPLGGNL
ncbi:MAG TPA: UDP-N-acetylmuramate dehydrogenase [Acidimicrobiia bacterium]|nr:UDP-N-acetylmuramate dehydrogenase [Acidimicrobiia bacterium]